MAPGRDHAPPGDGPTWTGRSTRAPWTRLPIDRRITHPRRDTGSRRRGRSTAAFFSRADETRRDEPGGRHTRADAGRRIAQHAPRQTDEHERTRDGDVREPRRVPPARRRGDGETPTESAATAKATMMVVMETETRDDTPHQKRRRGATMGRAFRRALGR